MSWSLSSVGQDEGQHRIRIAIRRQRRLFHPLCRGTGTPKEIYAHEKRPIYEGRLQRRPTHRERDPQKRLIHTSKGPMHEGGCKGDLHIGKETFKRDLNTSKEANKRRWLQRRPIQRERDLQKRSKYIKRDQYIWKGTNKQRKAAKVTNTQEKRPSKETFKRDLQKRHSKETCGIPVRHGSFIGDIKRDLQNRPTKEICLREMSHVHAGKETFKRDLQKRPAEYARDMAHSREEDVFVRLVGILRE